MASDLSAISRFQIKPEQSSQNTIRPARGGQTISSSQITVGKGSWPVNRARALTRNFEGRILGAMFAKVNADYTSFPATIRDAMPIIDGELHELRMYWQVYRFLFMEKKQKTIFLFKRFGPMLGLFQSLLESQMILSISCLTDKDNRYQQSLSLWVLQKAIPFAKDKQFGRKVNAALKRISKTVKPVRLHRNKHIAHFDLKVATGQSPLQPVVFRQLKSALQQMEKFLNLFNWEFQQMPHDYENLPCDEITMQAFETACKSKVFDEMVEEDLIMSGEVERRMDKWPWWKWH